MTLLKFRRTLCIDVVLKRAQNREIKFNNNQIFKDSTMVMHRAIEITKFYLEQKLTEDRSFSTILQQ